MKRIIVNGANGYVASHFILNLLERNYEVTALVRGDGKTLPEERMNNVLAEISDGRYRRSDKLKVCAYSLLEEDFSIPEKYIKEIFEVQADFFHFAASLKYNDRSKDEIFRTNISGVENSIRVFSRYAPPGSRFFMVSTAYSCGHVNGLFKETFYDNDECIGRFRNYYEQSKRFAENVVRKSIREDALPGHVIRLSQVVGDSRSGVTRTDYGIFDFVRRIYNLSRRYPNRTVRIRVDPEGTQNLIPVDTAVHYLILLAETEPLPRVIHVVAKKAVQNGYIIESLNRLLPIRLIPDNSLDTAAMDVCERIVAIGMSFTGSYTRNDIAFDTGNLDALSAAPCGDADEASVFRMLEYFIGHLSKKGIYTPAG